MSEQFDIAVKIDPGNSAASLRQIIDGLTKAEKAAKAAQDAAREAATELRNGMQGAANAMGPFVRAMELEARLLQSITGKSKDYGFELAALQKLHREGRISNEQYIGSLKKMGVEFENTAQKAEHLRRAQAQQASNTIGFGSATPQSIKGPGLGAMAAGLAGGPALAAGLTAGLMAGAEKIDDYIEAQDLAIDKYILLENSARRFTDATTSTNQVLAEQGSLSKQLQSTLGPTMDLYDSIGDVTGDLNLSHRELIGLTKTLGQAALAEGKSFDAAGLMMGQLSIAMQAGVGEGGQLQKVFRDFPPLGEALAKAWDTDTAGVIRMVTAHEKGIEDITRTWSSSIPEIEAAAAKLRQTHATTVAQFEERTTIQYGKGAGSALAVGLAAAGKDIDDFKLHMEGAALVVEARGKTAAEVVGGITSKLRDQATEWQRVEDAARKALEDKIVALSHRATQAVNGLFVGVQGLADAFASDGFFAIVKAADPWFVKPEMPSKISAATAELKKFNEELNRGAGARNFVHPAFDISVTNGMMSDLGDPSGGLSALDENRRRSDGINQEILDDLAKARAKRLSDEKKANDELAKSAAQAAQETREAWGSGLGEIGGSFLRMAAEGKSSFHDMVNQMMQDLTQLLIRMAAMKLVSAGGSSAVGGQFLSGLAGGAHGFDYTANANALQLPGFAHGTDGIVSGGGGIDSHLLMARISAGESFHVRTPQQREEARASAAGREGRGGNSGRPLVNVIVRNDPREVTAAMGTYAGMQATAHVDRKFGRRRTG